jgi:hydrogenase-4 component H
VMTEEFDIASDQRCNLRDHVEKELVCCEICGEPVATRDHLLWIARRVGPSAYSNPTIMFPLVNTLMGRTGEPLRKGGGVSGRADRFRVLCPRHRREATIEFALEK